MTTMRLNSHLGQFGGFTHRQGVFGGDPKMPIAAAGDPHFEVFMNPKEDQATKKHHFLGIIFQIRRASRTTDSIGKLNLRLNRRFRKSGNGVSLFRAAFRTVDKSENKRGYGGQGRG